MTLDRSAVEALFRLLEDPEQSHGFFDRVADDVEWTVMGTHPLAGTFRSKANYLAATFGRLGPLMRGGTHVTLIDVFVDGDTVVAELLTHSVTLEGAPFDDALCWVCRFDGEHIVKVRAYLDSAMVTWTVHRNELFKGTTA